MSNSEIIEWLKKKAETVTMPGARKMYQAAVRALEAQKDMVSRRDVIDYCEALMHAERVQQTDDWGYGRERYNQTEAILHHIETMSPTILAPETVSRKTANVAICNACGKIDCDQADKCEKLFATQEAAVKQGEIRPGDEVERYVDGRYDGRAMFLAEDNDRWTCLFWTGCGYTTLSYPKSQFKRTGRHYEIEPILEGIRNES